jgi:undecaprenyl-diphosphatase
MSEADKAKEDSFDQPPSQPAVRVETRLLIAGVLLTAAFLALIFVVDLAEDGIAGSFDRAVLLALQTSTEVSDPIGPRWVEEVARDLTSLGSYSVMLLIVAGVIGYLFLIRRGAAAVFVLASIGGGIVLSNALKHFFQRARPDIAPHAAEVFSTSFPSGHAMLSAVVYLTLAVLVARFALARRQRLYAIGIATGITILVGLTRMYLGVHWPTDIAAGWCVGAAWALACWYIAAKLQANSARMHVP